MFTSSHNDVKEETASKRAPFTSGAGERRQKLVDLDEITKRMDKQA